jgi:SAM-dependent methyltransferase
MFEVEARWLGRKLEEFDAAQLSPLLNLGSSTREFREQVQPATVTHMFEPLRARGVEVIHLDRRTGNGIDIRADLLDDGDFARLRPEGYSAVLCCNVLEHVADAAEFARRCWRLARPGGLVIATVPRSYPRHGDPIDTLFRPTPPELARLFPGAEMLASDIIDVGESYRDAVRRRPWILLRHLARLPFPFLGWEKWRASMVKPYWLLHNYQVTAVILRRPESEARRVGEAAAGQAALVSARSVSSA